MTAIVTQDFRITNASNFKEDISSGDTSVYIFVGKSDPWNTDITSQVDNLADTPLDTISHVSQVHENLMSGKIISASDVTHIIPRFDWTSGNTYVPWDSTDEDIFSKEFYVITDELKVYKCLVAGPAASTEQPVHSTIAPVQEGDGYVWKYMYTLSAADSTKFLTSSYLPVKTVVIPDGGTILDLPEADQTQFTNQQNSAATLDGAIFYIKMTSFGSGYTSAPTVTIDGTGTGWSGTAVVSGGLVVGVATSVPGTGYKSANVTFTGGGGTGATGVVVLSPANGHGSDPVTELGSSYVGVNVKFDGGDGSGDFVVDNQFRQIGIIKDPVNYGTTTIATDTTWNALRSLNMSSHAGFVNSDYITGATSGAVAFIDYYDANTGQIKYHMNEKTGYVEFSAGETITGAIAGSGSINTLVDPEINPHSGEVIFLENREPVDRSDSQLEDVKIIVEF